MGKLLIDDYPLQVLPKLAKVIGLNEAIFLQQLHYWLVPDPTRRYKPHYRVWEGQELPWVYNTYERKVTKDGHQTGWEANFPFWSARTIMRIVTSLKKRNLIITTDEFNQLSTDRTLWYTINYEEVDRLEDDIVATSTMTKWQPSEDDNSADSRDGQSGNLLPETPSETLPETTSETKEEATKKTSPTNDPIYLPPIDVQLDILFPTSCRGIEDYIQLINQTDWKIHSDDIRLALAHFLKASGLDIPNDESTRKDWGKSISQHVKNHGVSVLANAYPVTITKLRRGKLTIGRPGALTKTLPDVIRSQKEQTNLPPPGQKPPRDPLEAWWSQQRRGKHAPLTQFKNPLEGSRVVSKENSSLVIAVPNANSRDWLQNHLDKIAANLPGVDRLEIVEQ